MNSSIKSLVILSLVVVVGACASPKQEDPRVTNLRNQYEQLAGNPDLGPRGGEELKTAESALRRLSDPKMRLSERELDLAVFTADRLIKVAEFEARTRLADDQRGKLAIERERLVAAARGRETQQARQMADQARKEAAEAMAMTELAKAEAVRAGQIRAEAETAQLEAEQARMNAMEMQRTAEEAADRAMRQAQVARTAAEEQTREADSARMAAEAAKAEAGVARMAAEAARAEAEAARAEALAARADREQMRDQLAELQAKQTERGLLLTLGDVLFEFNQSDLKPGVTRNLAPLVKVLAERLAQTVIVEGHTDGVGSKQYNLTLSEKRASAVRDFLVASGINTSRIAIEGLGPDLPVATNDTAEGRQQNRRVEVVLPNIETAKG